MTTLSPAQLEELTRETSSLLRDVIDCTHYGRPLAEFDDEALFSMAHGSHQAIKGEDVFNQFESLGKQLKPTSENATQLCQLMQSTFRLMRNLQFSSELIKRGLDLQPPR